MQKGSWFLDSRDPSVVEQRDRSFGGSSRRWP